MTKHYVNVTIMYGGVEGDSLMNHGDQNVIAYGYGEDDQIGDAAGPDLLRSADKYYGGPGDDILLSVLGEDKLFGGKGSDLSLIDEHRGTTLVDGGRGMDIAYLFAFDEDLATVTELKNGDVVITQDHSVVVLKSNVEIWDFA